MTPENPSPDAPRPAAPKAGPTPPAPVKRPVPQATGAVPRPQPAKPSPPGSAASGPEPVRRQNPLIGLRIAILAGAAAITFFILAFLSGVGSMFAKYIVDSPMFDTFRVKRPIATATPHAPAAPPLRTDPGNIPSLPSAPMPGPTAEWNGGTPQVAPDSTPFSMPSPTPIPAATPGQGGGGGWGEGPEGKHPGN